MHGTRPGRSRLPGWARTALISAIAVALAALSAAARAQEAAAPLVPFLTSVRTDDRLAHQGGPRVESALGPLWLTLSGGLFSQAAAFSGCDARADASGNSLRGFALQRHSFLRLAPQLVLHRFSMAGCAVDAGSGAGLSYAVPLRKRLWLMHSAGYYRLPAPGGAHSPLISLAARVDLVKQLAWGRTLSVGLGTRSGSGHFNALHFSGSF